MGDFSQVGSGALRNVGIDLGDTTGTSVSTASGANSKGSWVELTSSSPLTAHQVVICIGSAGDQASYLIDIGIGQAGSEVVLIPNLPWQDLDGSNAFAEDSWRYYYIPITISFGRRIVARAQSDDGGGSVDVSLRLVNWGLGGVWGQAISEFGADLSTSGGTAVATGGSAATKGSWVEFSASTPRLIRGLMMATTRIGSEQDWKFLTDIGVGPAGSETSIVSNLQHWDRFNGRSHPNQMGPFPISIPQGSRLAVRSAGEFGGQTAYPILYGIR